MARLLVSARKIDRNFVDEFEKAIKSKEQVSFDYVNKQGKTSLVTITPTKIEKKWGKQLL